MKSLHLFAGIGGGILADAILGNEIVGAVEILPYCRTVLRQHQEDGFLPPFPVFEDVREFDYEMYVGKTDLVCGGFPAKILVRSDKEKDLKDESQACSTNLLGYVEQSVQSTSSSKTPHTLTQEDSIPFSKKLPRWGSMRNGVLYRRGSVAHLICATDGGVYAGDKMYQWRKVSLIQSKSNNGGKPVLDLSRLPTPRCHDAKQMCQADYNRKAPCLAATVEQDGGKLNPQWVEWLMNFPIGWTQLRD